MQRIFFGIQDAKAHCTASDGKKQDKFFTKWKCREKRIGDDAYIGLFCRASCYASVGVGLPDDPPGFVSHSLQKTMSLRGRTAPVAIRTSTP